MQKQIVLMLCSLMFVNVSLAESALPDAVLGKAGEPRGKELRYFDANPEAKGYLAIPDMPTTKGAVILIHEWDGLSKRVKQVADAFADEGYVALAADLYSGRLGTNREENMVLVRETLSDMDQIIANLDAAAKFLKNRDDISGKVAAIGWCYGGGVALSYALGSDNHEGTAIFYGRLLSDPDEMAKIHHEIYGTFAGQDRGITVAQVGEFVSAMRNAGIKNDVHIYDDVQHGFWLHVDRDPETNTEPAEDAWARLKNYLDRTIN